MTGLFTSPSLAGLWAAAEAGLGVTLRTGVGVPAGLVVLDPVASSLPTLPSMPLTPHVADAGPAPAVARLAEILRDTIAERTGRPV